MAETTKLEGPEAKRQFEEDAAKSGFRPDQTQRAWGGLKSDPEAEVGMFPPGSRRKAPWGTETFPREGGAPGPEAPTGPRMPMARKPIPSFAKIATTEQFQALPPKEQARFRQRYFDEILARTPGWSQMTAAEQQEHYKAIMGGDLKQEQPKDFMIDQDPYRIAAGQSPIPMNPLRPEDPGRKIGFLDVLAIAGLPSGMHAPRAATVTGQAGRGLWQRLRSVLPPYEFKSRELRDTAKIEELLKGGPRPAAGATATPPPINPGLPRNLTEMQEMLRRQDKAAFDKAMREAIDSLTQAQNVGKAGKKVRKAAPKPSEKPAAEYTP